MPPNVVDYLNLGDKKNASWNDQAPAVPPPGSGSDTVLQIYVPAENTVIDYGAGAIPGIRMATDHHAHLTAGTPRTTISLGKAAGPSVSGSDGLNIFTAGAKTEEVMEYTFEHYHAAKQERVDGAWDEHCGEAKSEEIVGCLTRKVGGVVSDEFAQDYISKVGGNHVETVAGNSSIIYGGLQDVHYGGPQQSFFESHKLDHHSGLKMGMYTGAQLSINVGAKVDIMTGVALSTSQIASIKVDSTFAFAKNLGFDLSQKFISKSTVDVDLNKTLEEVSESLLKLNKGKFFIASRIANIFK